MGLVLVTGDCRCRLTHDVGTKEQVTQMGRDPHKVISPRGINHGDVLLIHNRCFTRAIASSSETHGDKEIGMSTVFQKCGVWRFAGVRTEDDPREQIAGTPDQLTLRQTTT